MKEEKLSRRKENKNDVVRRGDHFNECLFQWDSIVFGEVNAILVSFLFSM